MGYHGLYTSTDHTGEMAAKGAEINKCWIYCHVKHLQQWSMNTEVNKTRIDTDKTAEVTGKWHITFHVFTSNLEYKVRK